mmetsp:Transcript_5881/g.13599  ORF Transcript_5881/g.13599 Transcript_5881/m.13599 type:complete len:165 (+) Transcript_5881:75-569(+)
MTDLQASSETESHDEAYAESIPDWDEVSLKEHGFAIWTKSAVAKIKQSYNEIAGDMRESASFYGNSLKEHHEVLSGDLAKAKAETEEILQASTKIRDQAWEKTKESSTKMLEKTSGEANRAWGDVVGGEASGSAQAEVDTPAPGVGPVITAHPSPEIPKEKTIE